jgi:threonine/homoserine/homoserine lactone efflux protein
VSIAIIPLAIFAASQVGTPGPANMALMATGARFGFRAALPFVAGVALGKQFIIWPVGYGLMELAEAAPAVFTALKYLSAAYIIWLAWKVANLRLGVGEAGARPPGFLAGLIVHPLNPKAWAMIVGSFTAFIGPDIQTFTATATVAAVLFTCQLLMHPLWTLGGQAMARTVAGTAAEPYLMWTLAALTVASVLFVLFAGGA